MKKKIIELEILDDLEQSGVSAIALVDVPAIEKYWMAFRKEEFVEPNSGETEDEFIPRCIAYNIEEGKPEDQAVAICYSVWENHSKQEFAATYTDYPEEAVENAKRALAYAEENGWGDCGMGPGKARANQLANREPISEETIARMSAFERHRQNSETPYGEGCGKLMWDAWGGSAGIEWAARKLREIRGEEFAGMELNVYGYRTTHFYMCPGATETFQNLLHYNENPDIVGMVRSAAVVADKLFELEDNVIASGKANYGDMEEAIVLAEDFGDIMEEISKLTGEEYNIDYMLGHVEKIREYYTEKFAASPIQRIPKEERSREGSDVNKPGDTTTSRGGIEVTEEVEKTLKDKIEEHNKKNIQDSQKADLGMLKAVWRRGAGAYSVGTPGRRGMTRSQWAMGRVNAFLKILSGSSPSDKDYTQDNDLLPKGHPKHSEEKMGKEQFAKVSFDYDDTLSTNRGMDLARLKQVAGDDLYIISARGTVSSEMRQRAKNLGIPESRIFATGSNARKIQKVRDLGIDIHIDNNADVIKELGPIGLKFDYDLQLPVYVDELPKKKVDLSAALEYFRGLKALKESDFEANGMEFTKETEGMDMEFAAGYTVYRYEGSVGADTRDFCSEMVADGGFYTFEEIVGFNSDNPGFGPGGSDEYSIFHYKGGPNCKHHWQKYYVNAKGVRENKGPAPGKAGTEPYDMPNRGYMMSKLLFASEDQQILVGPVAVPDMEIVRKDKKTKEIYYVKFSKEVVQRMAEKFMKELRNDQTNIEHDNEDKAGSYIMETWIVENEEDKANSVYGLNVPVGTWCVKMRVEDPETWKLVKKGELRGFSLEGNFMDKEDWEAYQKDREIYNKVIRILRST